MAAALAFVLLATAIQRLLGRITLRRGPAESPSVPPAPKSRPVQAPVGPEEFCSRDARTERDAPVRSVPSPARRSPALATYRRARRILREPGGLKTAILAREILGPAKGLSRPKDPR